MLSPHRPVKVPLRNLDVYRQAAGRDDFVVMERSDSIFMNSLAYLARRWSTHGRPAPLHPEGH